MRKCSIDEFSFNKYALYARCSLESGIELRYNHLLGMSSIRIVHPVSEFLQYPGTSIGAALWFVDYVRVMRRI